MPSYKKIFAFFLSERLLQNYGIEVLWHFGCGIFEFWIIEAMAIYHRNARCNLHFMLVEICSKREKITKGDRKMRREKDMDRKTEKRKKINIYGSNCCFLILL